MSSDTCPNCGYAAKRKNPDCGDHPTPMPDNTAIDTIMKLVQSDHDAHCELGVHCEWEYPGTRRGVTEAIKALITSEKINLLERLEKKLPPNTNYRENMSCSDLVQELNINVRAVRELLEAELKTLRGGK